MSSFFDKDFYSGKNILSITEGVRNHKIDIALPNFHAIQFYASKEKYIVGKILDFGLTVITRLTDAEDRKIKSYNKKNNKEFINGIRDILKRSFNDMAKEVVSFIEISYFNNMLDSIYDNSPKIENEHNFWNLYINKAKIKKIENLKTSFNLHIIRSLEKYLPELDSETEKILIEKYILYLKEENNDIEKDSLKDIRKTISLIINSILDSKDDEIYELKLMAA